MKNIFRIIAVVVFIVLGGVAVSTTLSEDTITQEELVSLNQRYGVRIQTALNSIQQKMEAFDDQTSKGNTEQQWTKIASTMDAEFRPIYEAIAADSPGLADDCPKRLLGEINSDLKKVICWGVYVRHRTAGKSPAEALMEYMKYIHS